MKKNTTIFLSIFISNLYSNNYSDLCDSTNIKMYIGFENRYLIESKYVKDYICKKVNQELDTSQNGYITYQFIINCNGKVSKMKIYEIDTLYSPYKFKKAFVNQLQYIIENLNVYKILSYKNDKGFYVKYDYLIFFTFKISNGKISYILP